MACKERLEEMLRDAGVDFEEVRHPEAFTAQEVAAAEHVPGRILAKVVVVFAGDDLTLLALPASSMVDLEKARTVLGADVRLATEDEFKPSLVDCDAGAMPPFGQLFDLPLYVDSSLSDEDDIVFQAGTHVDTIKMKYPDYERVARPQVADFASHL